MATKEQEVHSLAIGDYVLFARKKPGPSIFNDDLGREGHISGVTMTQGQLEYAFEGRAWFPHSCFDLILRATPEALKHVARINCEDDEDTVALEKEWEQGSDEEDEADGPWNTMDAAAAWFMELDTDISVEYSSDMDDNALVVKSKQERLIEIFDRTTEFDLADKMDARGITATVVGEDLKLVFTFFKPRHCVIKFYDTNGGDADEVTADMLREFSAFDL